MSDFLWIVLCLVVLVAVYELWYVVRPRKSPRDKWRCVCGWHGETPKRDEARPICPRCFRSNLLNDL